MLIVGCSPASCLSLPPLLRRQVFRIVRAVQGGTSAGLELDVRGDMSKTHADQTMYETSEEAVGYAHVVAIKSSLVAPCRIANAKTLMSSSAFAPSRCAPRS